MAKMIPLELKDGEYERNNYSKLNIYYIDWIKCI